MAAEVLNDGHCRIVRVVVKGLKQAAFVYVVTVGFVRVPSWEIPLPDHALARRPVDIAGVLGSCREFDPVVAKFDPERVQLGGVVRQ